MSDVDGPTNDSAAGAAASRAAEVMERLIASADDSKVNAAPIEHGERLLIPAAEVVATSR